MFKKILKVLLLLCLIISCVGCVAPAPVDTYGDNGTSYNSDETLSAQSFDFSIVSAYKSDYLKNTLDIEYSPTEGNVFVVIVFNVTNTCSDTRNVMNMNFNSYVDDTKITVQSVIGEIDGYMPLIGAVSAGKSFAGYTVWEVPANSKALEFSYIDALTCEESATILVSLVDLKHT